MSSNETLLFPSKIPTGPRAVVFQLCVMIKARVGLEETYAKGLEKVANQVAKVV